MEDQTTGFYIKIIDNIKCPKGLSLATCPTLNWLKNTRTDIVIPQRIDGKSVFFDLNDDVGNGNSFDDVIYMFMDAKARCFQCQQDSCEKKR